MAQYDTCRIVRCLVLKQLPRGSLHQTSNVKQLFFGFFFVVTITRQFRWATWHMSVWCRRSGPGLWHRPPLLLEQLESGSGRRSSGSPSRILHLVRCLRGPTGRFDSGSPWNCRASRRVGEHEKDGGGGGSKKKNWSLG